jgi:hypothetical protein
MITSKYSSICSSASRWRHLTWLSCSACPVSAAWLLGRSLLLTSMAAGTWQQARQQARRSAKAPGSRHDSKHDDQQRHLTLGSRHDSKHDGRRRYLAVGTAVGAGTWQQARRSAEVGEGQRHLALWQQARWRCQIDGQGGLHPVVASSVGCGRVGWAPGGWPGGG